MTSRSGPVAWALRIAAEDDRRVRADIARARRGAGLSQADVGRPCGLSRSTEARTESGNRRATIEELACLGATVGLDVRVRAYPRGDAIRDAGQARLLERLRVRLAPALRWSTEVPLPITGDPRAWDAVIRGAGWRIGVEGETVLDDMQAVERRVALKRRDGQVDHVVLLVADTPRNRRALAATPASFRDLPLRTRAVLAALRDGRDPGASGIVVL
jgi:transcriptional regulator with XRE-family HTH domain